MCEPSHLPNELEITLSLICLFISSILTGIIFPLIVSTDKLPLSAAIGLLIIIFLMILLAIQSVFNLYYRRSQKKRKKK